MGVIRNGFCVTTMRFVSSSKGYVFFFDRLFFQVNKEWTLKIPCARQQRACAKKHEREDVSRLLSRLSCPFLHRAPTVCARPFCCCVAFKLSDGCLSSVPVI
jgi:hypothetical protein